MIIIKVIVSLLLNMIKITKGSVSLLLIKSNAFCIPVNMDNRKSFYYPCCEEINNLSLPLLCGQNLYNPRVVNLTMKIAILFYSVKANGLKCKKIYKIFLYEVGLLQTFR